MDRKTYRVCTPVCDAASMDARPLLDLNSNYVLRAAANLPKQSGRKPWLIKQNYILDMLMMKMGRIEDGILKFTSENPVASPMTEEMPMASAGD